MSTLCCYCNWSICVVFGFALIPLTVKFCCGYCRCERVFCVDQCFIISLLLVGGGQLIEGSLPVKKVGLGLFGSYSVYSQLKP